VELIKTKSDKTPKSIFTRGMRLGIDNLNSLETAGLMGSSHINHRLSLNTKGDNLGKSRFKDWIPAFAGMTSVVSI
jgi:hypothetical protein